MATLNRDNYHTELKGSEQHIKLSEQRKNQGDPSHADDDNELPEKLRATVEASDEETQIADELRKMSFGD